MTGTKGPLYKKKYHAAHQLYPKIPGWGAGGLALHTHPQDGVGGSHPCGLLEDDPADRNGTINSGNGLSVGGGNPRQTPEQRGIQGVVWVQGTPGRTPPSQEAQARYWLER